LSTGDEGHEPAGPNYRWYVVGLLWFCGFFNYADRQAINAVFPLIETEFHLSKSELGMLGSAFMVVYALMGMLAGFVVDQFSRKALIASGLAFWSVVCAATGTARSFAQLLLYRAIEGLGESFYFPASMTILSDYHPPETRSRAMSIHQTSVYAGTIGGAIVAGYLGPIYGWRSPFLVLGAIGTAYALWLFFQIIEPVRGKSDAKPEVVEEIATRAPSLMANVVEIASTPPALVLLLVFAGANFVAAAFLTWTTSLVFDRFGISLLGSSIAATAWSFSSPLGALGGGWLADRSSKRLGGRARIQGMALLCASPFVAVLGTTSTVKLTALALAGVGLCKGAYDANIFASLYDVVRPALRGTAAGLMNTVGWAGGSLAPLAVGIAAQKFGLGTAMSALAIVYASVGILGLIASGLAAARADR
jgi:MFS family permease